MKRLKELMLQCAQNLEDGCNPLNSDFLCDNKVTADECFTLAEQMAVAIKAYCNSSPEEKTIAIMRSMLGDGVTEEMIKYTESQMKLKSNLGDFLDNLH